MFRPLFGFWLIASLGSGQSPKPPGDISATLSRADALYYDASFEEVIDLLSPLAESLRPQAGRVPDKIAVQLYLAQAYVGLNQPAEAKLHFAEIFSLDSRYSLNPRQFSSKVITVFDEAKAESRCTTTCAEVSQALERGNSAPLIQHIGSVEPKCPCLERLASDASERLYLLGVDAYARDNLAEAMRNFQAVLQLQPGHKLTVEYLGLMRAKLTLAVDRIALQWRRNLDSGDFASATADYQQLLSLNVDGGAQSRLTQMRAEYQTIVSQLLERWRGACQSANVAAMDTLRKQARELPSDVAGSGDVLKQMTCTQRGCLQMDASAVMPRLIRRVEPVIPAGLRQLVEKSGTLTVYVQAKISDGGDVAVIETQGINPGIRNAVGTAVKNWKFSPTAVENENRCVDTILEVVIKR